MNKVNSRPYLEVFRGTFNECRPLKKLLFCQKIKISYNHCNLSFVQSQASCFSTFVKRRSIAQVKYH